MNKTGFVYRNVASRSMSRLVAHTRIFRMFMKVKFDAYVLWPLAKMFQNWIVDSASLLLATLQYSELGAWSEELDINISSVVEF